MQIWLGKIGQEKLLSAMGRKLKEGYLEIARTERTASGRLVKDIVARKKKFSITYSTITTEILNDLLEIYEMDGELNIKVEQEDGTIKEYAVNLAPFEADRNPLASGWIWGGITLELEEI